MKNYLHITSSTPKSLSKQPQQVNGTLWLWWISSDLRKCFSYPWTIEFQYAVTCPYPSCNKNPQTITSTQPNLPTSFLQTNPKPQKLQTVAFSSSNCDNFIRLVWETQISLKKKIMIFPSNSNFTKQYTKQKPRNFIEKKLEDKEPTVQDIVDAVGNICKCRRRSEVV